MSVGAEADRHEDRLADAPVPPYLGRHGSHDPSLPRSRAVTATETPPERIRTPNLVLRRWRPADAPRLAEALERSEPELRTWTPWVLAPAEPGGLELRLRRFEREFDTGESFIYGAFDPAGATVLGQAGLYARIGPNALEVGYWIRSDATGRGYATEAARALTDVAFRACGVARVEMRCDPANAASVAIPRRLGFRLREVLEPADAPAGGDGRGASPLMVWERERADG